VYHDAGNLNYTFCCGRDRYGQDEVYQAVMNGLRMLGIPVKRMGKSSLAVDGRKVSGNAFCYRRNSVMQHGTILVDADLDRLRRSLSPSSLSFDTHAVRSEPAEVVNLSDLNPLWDLEQVGLAATAGFEETYGPIGTRQCSDDLHPERMQELHHRFCSPEWRLGKTPGFQVRIHDHEIDVRLEVRHGRVSRVSVESDGGVPWAGCLGSWFTADDIAATLGGPPHLATVRHRLRDLGL
jgi:lipoate-protein ligase A